MKDTTMALDWFTQRTKFAKTTSKILPGYQYSDNLLSTSTESMLKDVPLVSVVTPYHPFYFFPAVTDQCFFFDRFTIQIQFQSNSLRSNAELQKYFAPFGK